MANKSNLALMLIALFLFPSGSHALGDDPFRSSAGSAWDISDTVMLKDTTIVMNGDLTVHPGGSLILDHVTLKMNVGEDGQYRIEVDSGAAMYIGNGSVITDGDEDNDSLPASSMSNARFCFVVKRWARFEMRDSELHECGFASDDWSNRGLYIEADNPVIEGNRITHNFQGIFLHSVSGARLVGNQIDSNSRGVCLHTSKHDTLIGNSISYNYGTGLMIDESDSNLIQDCVVIGNSRAPDECGSFYLWDADYNRITNCTINRSFRRGLLVFGRCLHNTIKANTIKGNGWEGIFLADSACHNVIEDCVIADNVLGGINIATSPAREAIPVHYGHCNTIKNCIIGNNHSVGIRLGYLSDSTLIQDTRIVGNRYGILIDSTSTGNRITGSDIAESAVHGVYIIRNSSATIEDCNLSSNNGDGIRSEEGSYLIAVYNNITNNRGYGVCNTDSTVTVDARHNWWGSAAGPGDGVSERVLFEPWLREPAGEVYQAE